MTDMMKVTDVVVFPIKKRDEKIKLFAFAKVVLNDQFIIHGIRIYEGVNGAFMTFPQDTSGEYNEKAKTYNICHPATSALREHISEQVLAEYALTVSVHPVK